MKLEFFSKRTAIRYLKARSIRGATFEYRAKRTVVTVPGFGTNHAAITKPCRLRDSLRQFEMAVPLSPRQVDARGQLGKIGKPLSEVKYG